ncbi:MAG TPA: hypothetical protein VLZ89_08125 [Anaerolineales bacterium]|nr:hypothetical protein [Anaerolineales bacterium]
MKIQKILAIGFISSLFYFTIVQSYYVWLLHEESAPGTQDAIDLWLVAILATAVIASVEPRIIGIAKIHPHSGYVRGIILFSIWFILVTIVTILTFVFVLMMGIWPYDLGVRVQIWEIVGTFLILLISAVIAITYKYLPVDNSNNVK